MWYSNGIGCGNSKISFKIQTLKVERVACLKEKHLRESQHPDTFFHFDF